ncbi:MAG: hypothetical protein D3910_28915, partial [Candidatus Electrothrix sp. ATG2]|nr:hypothetical protein [Candidatus Electrothrix sp. ATG2]
IVSISGVPGISYKEPLWLQFYGRAGAGNPKSAIKKGLTGKLEEKGVPKDVAKFVADLWVGILNKIENFNGPQMPKVKSEWASPSQNP